MVHRHFSTLSLLLAALPLMIASAGCARALASPIPAPAPAVTQTSVEIGLHASTGTVAASGEVVPAQEAQLSFPVSGRVQTVAVTEGDEVQSGDVLVALETGLLETDVAQAQAALEAAQAHRALLEAGPRPGDVAVAQAQVQAAEARLAQATAQRNQLTARATEAEIAAARAQLAAAQAEEKSTRIAYDQLRDRKVEDWEEEVALLRLRAAEQGRVAAEAQIAMAEQGAKVQVRAAQAAVQAAAAQRDLAQAQLDLLQAGVSPEEIAAAQAQVAQAEAALQAARAALDQATFGAPFPGTIAALEVAPGETVLPGQVVLELADLARLQAETTDLSEQDVDRVQVGQQATVFVEPLGVEVVGRVIDIARRAETVGGDVVYRVVIGLGEQPLGLRWGMSVEVEIATE
jgi:multidrug efflux pump subunit AcrA (membrane-fusion protein)